MDIVAEPNNKNLPLQTEEKPSPETAGGLSFQVKETGGTFKSQAVFQPPETEEGGG